MKNIFLSLLTLLSLSFLETINSAATADGEAQALHNSALIEAQKELDEEITKELTNLTLLPEEKWSPDPLTELTVLLTETHALFSNYHSQKPLSQKCNALRESWFNIAGLKDAHHSFETFYEKVRANYRRCHINGTPPLHICLGLESEENITPKSILYFDQIVTAANDFKKNKDEKSLDFLRESLSGIYCRLETEFGKPPFDGITKESFLQTLARPETASDSIEKMLSVLRQAIFLARERNDLELYKAFKKGKDVFISTKADYIAALDTLNLTTDSLSKIIHLLSMLGAGEITEEELQEGLTITTLPQEAQSTSSSRASQVVRSVSSSVQAFFTKAMSLFPTGTEPIKASSVVIE